MRFIDFFAGIGGISLGLERAGHECVGHCETDEYACKVLKKHWPDLPLFGDIKEIDANELPEAELWCGGFPCQDISNAGGRAGIHGERSGLFFDFMRLVREIRPRFLLLENVRALINRGLAEVLGEMAESGYNAEWHSIEAAGFGAPHRRSRTFLLAYSSGNGRQRNLCEIAAQEIHNFSPETLGAWNSPSHPFFDIQKLMGTPGICRLPNGVSSTLDIRPALRCYGNAVVPQVAEYIGRLLLQEPPVSPTEQ